MELASDPTGLQLKEQVHVSLEAHQWSISNVTRNPSIRELMSQPHFGLSVKVKPTLPKVGSWSPPGLPETQSSIAGFKSPRI
jgi:hypothetical protein